MSPGRFRQVEEIFHAALDLPAHERPDFLERACGGDAGLRAEVESLLGCEETAQHHFAGVSEAVASNLDAALPPSSANNEVGVSIGPYLLVREIGRGGMGVVYQAVRSDGEFFQSVALKLVKRGVDNEHILRRFRTERQILATLTHPNIAGLLDGGTTPDGRPYFVMEFVDGKPFVEYARERNLPVPERIEIFRKVCAAVHYAHRQMVIHRDLKPGNILVTPDGTPKLLDFGIAKLLAPELVAGGLPPTEPLMRMMTPDYASPEQVRGETVTPASDIYSLGAVLYELLTDRRPHQATGRLPLEVERAILREDPPPPSAQVEDPKLRREIAGDLDNIVARAMDKEPGRRYGTAQQLADDLRRYLDGLPVLAHRDTAAYRVRKFVLRNPALATAALAALAATGGGVGYVMWQRYQAAEARQQALAVHSLAVLPFWSLTAGPEARDLARNLAGDVRQRLARIPNLRVTAAASRVDVLAGGGEAVLEGTVRRENGAYRITTQLRNLAGRQTLWAEALSWPSGDPAALRRQMADAIANALTERIEGRAPWRRTAHQPIPPEAEALYQRASELMRLDPRVGGWTGRLPSTLQQAIELLEQATRLAPHHTRAWTAMAQAAEAAIDYDKSLAGEMREKALAAVRRALYLDDTLAEAHAIAATIHFLRDWDFAAAERDYRRSIELDPRAPIPQREYSDLLRIDGRIEESLAALDAALSIDLATTEYRLQGSAVQGRAILLTQRALVLYGAGRFAEAEQAAAEALDAQSDFRSAHWVMGLVLEALGKYAEAESRFRLVLGLTPLDARASAALGHLLGKTGRRKEALEMAAGLVRMREQGRNLAFSLAILYAGMGDANQAMDWLEKAHASHEPILPYCRVEPRLKPVKGHPRYQALLRKLPGSA